MRNKRKYSTVDNFVLMRYEIAPSLTLKEMMDILNIIVWD